jgi:hypothetical protein
MPKELLVSDAEETDNLKGPFRARGLIGHPDKIDFDIFLK